MHTLVPALAAALGQLHRSPGRDEAWVADVLGALERDRPVDYDRLRRRLGLARSLAALVPLQDEERATMAAGLFFHELIREAPLGEESKEARSWSAYLTQQEDWLAPCLALSQAVGSPDWENAGGKAASVAKVAAILDLEASEGHSRPLQILQSLASDAPNEAAQEVIELLWSEEGQQLCQGHFDRREKRYTLDPDEIRGDLELLRRSSAPTEADAPDDSQQSSRSDRGTNVGGEPRTDPQPSGGAASSDGFERRRQALRAGPSWGDQPGGGATDDGDQHAEELSEAREEIAMTTPDMTPAHSGHHDSAQLVEKLGELRSKLDQIQTVAAEGQIILASLAPQLEEVSSWMADLETMMDRWKSQHESTEAAA